MCTLPDSCRHVEHCQTHNHTQSSISVKVSRRTQKVKNLVANEGSERVFFTTDLCHIFGNNVSKNLGVLLRRKRPRKTVFLMTLSADIPS